MAIVTNRYVTLSLLLAAAIISYAIGFSVGAWLFVGLGVFFEGFFWIKLFRRRHHRSS